MTQLDRYVLSKLMALFGFFALVLVSVYWVNRAVIMFDSLISDGQTATVVLEFTALTLPYVIRIVLPVAAFAATIYAFNRLDQDSELVVMRATGTSNWRLARPVLVFGLIASVMMALLVNFLVPAAKARLAERQQEVAQNLTAKFLTEGTFQHPAPGISIYIRRISDLGELQDIFVSDSRSAQTSTIYTADKGVIVKTETGPKLIMFSGMAQTLRKPSDRLSVTRFSNFTYDIGSFLKAGKARAPKIDEMTTPRLAAMMAGTDLDATPGAESAKAARDALRLELARRITQPLLAPIAALIGFSALMMGTFSRFGMWRQMSLAIGGLIVVQVLQNAAETSSGRDPSLWPSLIAPTLGGIVMVLFMLWWSGRPRRIRPKREAAA
ncbi:LPS export ABC transporter permease LptF [Thioclava sp. F36-7]|uniref:LPS export ABC transporter permease LptF n=1 Tax=Thioclava sp. F36-7 TaxID=1915317 RepID=UPI000996325D|nr:LPS export ABC transporter permease LptF [Thioclava sp. F36-7]OOY09505.1 LPS export ABC transporter permease LptF [Thioclava sp. F36-7]